MPFELSISEVFRPIFVGIISGMGILGPALGFTLGGVFSRLYVTLEETNMSMTDPRWIGAWWLGFLFFGSLGIIAGIPLMFFPKRMKTRPQHLDKLKNKKKKDLLIKKSALCHNFKELMKSVIRLLTSPIYILCNLASCVLLIAVSGMLAFLPKYLESQYRIPTWKANILLGTTNVLAASLGVMIGGIFTSKMKLKPMTCLKLVAVITFASTFFVGGGFFLGCEPPQLHMGVNSAQVSNNGSLPVMTSNNVTHIEGKCDVNTCQCDDTKYFPVCGSDRLNYFSPCHAGCQHTDSMMYKNCTCIDHEEATAMPGLCSGECDTMLWIYISFNFLGAFFTTMTIMPSFVVYVRSIKESDKPLGVGLSAFLNTLLGFAPGPIIYGRVIDTTCVMWSLSCLEKGACSLYDGDDFRIKYHTLFSMCKLASSALYTVALVVALKKRQPFFLNSEKEICIADQKENILKTEGTKV